MSCERFVLNPGSWSVSDERILIRLSHCKRGDQDEEAIHGTADRLRSGLAGENLSSFRHVKSASNEDGETDADRVLYCGLRG